ncbi:hypothetical protein [Pontimicrobium sp. MEBiC01747]
MYLPSTHVKQTLNYLVAFKTTTKYFS